MIEHGRSGFSAYVPDLPGCVAVARTRQEVERLIEEAIVLHVAGLREDGLPVPFPQTEVATVDIADKVWRKAAALQALRGSGEVLN